MDEALNKAYSFLAHNLLDYDRAFHGFGRKLTHVPGIVTHVSARSHICTHGYEGHNLWHTLYISKWWFSFRLELTYANTPVASKNDASFKDGHNQPKNNRTAFVNLNL